MTMEGAFLRLARFVTRHAIAVLVALAAVTLLCAWLALGLRVDADVAGLLPRDSETRRLIDKYADQETVSELLLVGVSHPELLAPDRLAQVAEIDRRVSELPNVIDRLTPFNLLTFQRRRGRLVFGPLAPGGIAPGNAADDARWHEHVRAAPPALSALFNADVPAMNLVYSVVLQDDYDSLLHQVRAILAAHGEGLSIHVGGWLPLYEVARRYIVGELPLLGATAALITLLVCYLSFGTRRAVALPLLAIGMALVWTFGLMSFAGVPLSLPSLMLPPLVFALGSSYSVHFLNHYFRTASQQEAPSNGSILPGAPTAEAVARAAARVSQTVLLASLTTAAGLASLLVSGIQRLREFGIVSASGVVICALVTLLLFPAVLSRLRLPTGKQQTRLARGRLAAFAVLLTRIVPRRRWPLYAGLALLVAAFGHSARSVSFQTDVAGFFRGQVAAVADNLALIGRFGSFLDLNLTVSVDDPDELLDAELLRALADFEAAAAGHPNVSHVTSVVAYLRSLNQVATGQATYPHNPTVVHLFRRFLRLAESSEQDVGGLVDWRRGRVTTRIWIRDGGTGWLLLEREMRDLVQFLRRTAEATFPPESQPELWGWSMVTLRVAETLAREQLVSTGVSVLLVLVITTVAFRSVATGLLALLPLSTAIMLTFTLMVLFRIPLDALTISFSGVAIGVGVDDAIHFLLHYRRARLDNPDTALASTIQHTGRAILITTVAIVAGMAALAISRFLPVVYLGGLISIALLGATLGTLVLVPAVLGSRARSARPMLRPRRDREATVEVRGSPR